MRGPFIILLICGGLLGTAQVKPGPSRPGQPKSSKPGAKKSKEKAPDSLQTGDILPDTVDWRDYDIKLGGEFIVYSKKHNGKDKRMKLCIQLNGDTVLNQCFVDSICRNPEVYKELFRKKDGDSTFIFLYVDAFTKGFPDRMCDGGHETKLFFIRWNTETNRALFRQKNIASCIRAITRMSKVDVDGWDKTSPLVWEYHKGGNDFLEVKFDPAEYRKGLQTGAASVSDEGQQ